MAEGSTDGTLTVADVVIEKVAARAALEIEGVVRHRSNVGALLGSTIGHSALGSDLPHAKVESIGTARSVSLAIALEWPCAVAEVSRTTRDHVADRIDALVGHRPVRVDVTVERIVPHAETMRRRQGLIDLENPDDQD